MSLTKNTNERESFQKSHILKAGEYDLWTQEFKIRVRSIDGELQKIIISGDLAITKVDGKPIPFSAFSADDWSRDEKNIKALKLLTSGLDNFDRIFALLQDYDNFTMGEKKSIEEFQARFLTLINSLAHLGEKIEN